MTAPHPATLAPCFQNPVMISKRDGATIMPMNDVDSQVIYKGTFDSRIRTVLLSESESERKPKNRIESQSTCDRKLDTGISMVASGESEVKGNNDISMIVSGKDKDIFHK